VKFKQWFETNGNGNGAGIPQHGQASMQAYQQKTQQEEGMKFLQMAQNAIAHPTAPNIPATIGLLNQALRSFGHQSQTGRAIQPLLDMMQKEEGGRVGPSPNLQTYQQGLQIALNQAQGEYKDIRLK